MKIYYIENLGDQNLDAWLAELQTNDSSIEDCPAKACLDRQGKPITRNLRRIPVPVRDKIVRMTDAGFQFALYAGNLGVPPQEYFRREVALTSDPFAVAKNRRKGKVVLLRSVFRGAHLVMLDPGRRSRAKNT